MVISGKIIRYIGVLALAAASFNAQAITVVNTSTDGPNTDILW